MLRRRFMLGDSVPKYPYTITVGYYANEEIPFLGGYKYTPEMTVTTLDNSTHICKFSLLLSTYDATIGYGEYTIISESNGLGIVGRLSQDDSYPLTEYVGGLFGGLYLNDAGAYCVYDVSDKISAVILDGLVSALSVAWHGLTVSLPNYDITLPDSILYLGNRSLYIDVPTITIPKSVQYMDECLIFPDPGDLDLGLLFSCLNLKPCTPPSLGASKSIFTLQYLEGIRPDFKIRVYTDCLDTYKNDSVWGKYSNLYDTINNTIVYYNTNGRQLLEQLNDFINVPSNSKLKTATSIYLPNSVMSIGERAFENSLLTSINIPNSVTSIGNYAFDACSSLTSITIPNSVTSIGDNTFSGCTKLASIVIGNGVKSIGNYAFYGRKPLTSIVIPDSVENIGKYAFTYCSSLTDVTIGNSVISIGLRAFSECSSLTSVIIPNSVTNISYGTFKNCSSLTSITIPSSLISIEDEAFYGCSSLTEIVIPNSVTSIGKWAFYYCESLSSIVIPDGVTSIGEWTLSYSGLTSITLPNSITSIGEYALAVCTSLTSITFQGTILQWNSIVLGSNWKSGVPATVVHCTDGDIEL